MAQIKKNIKQAFLRGIHFMIPFAVSGGILVSLSYIIDTFSGGNAVYGLGSITPFAVVLKAMGSMAFTLMLPALSAAIAYEIGGRLAFASGIIGGFAAQNGNTLSLPYGDTSGVSGFFGAVGAGFLAGFCVLFLRKILATKTFATAHINKTVVIPVVSVFLVCLVMMLTNPLVSLINKGVTLALAILSRSNPILFGITLGALISLDLGGALSKATFIFASASIATGEYTAMASVMCAGMAVPLSIALCSVIFKNKFTPAESRLSKANFIFGLCFVTEGIYPFVAKEPLRILPCCALAGAVSGGLAAGFGCTLIAPVGGIFLLPIIGNPPLFLISLFAGTITGATFLGIIKKAPESGYSRVPLS